jgi:hypothetical protein
MVTTLEQQVQLTRPVPFQLEVLVCLAPCLGFAAYLLAVTL